MAVTSARRADRARSVLVSAAGVSSLGDGVLATAGPLAAAAVTRRPELVALVAAAEYVPWVVVSPYAGALVDRIARPVRVMVLADIVRAVLVAAVVWIVWSETLTIGVLVLLSLGIVGGSVFHDAAAQAVIADIGAREADALHRINGRMSAATTAGRQMVGPPMGSVLYAAAPWMPFAVDALSFASSAFLLGAVDSSPRTSAGPREGVHAAIVSGARFLIRHPLLRSLCLLLAVANLTYTMSWSTFVLLATSPEGLGLDTAAFGLVVLPMSIGGLVGGIWAAPAIRRLGARRVVVVGLLLEVGVWTAVASTRSPFVAGAALAVAGLCTSSVTVVAMSTRQQVAPPEMLARVVAAFRVVSVGASPIGAALGGVIAAHAGLRAPLWCAAAILALTLLVLLPATRSLGIRD